MMGKQRKGGKKGLLVKGRRHKTDQEGKQTKKTMNDELPENEQPTEQDIK